MKIRILTLLTFSIFISCSNLEEFRQIKTELYFGLSNSNGAISQSRWLEFKNKNIDKILDGYTIIKSTGYWTDENGKTINEDSRILIYVHNKSDSIDQRIDSIIKLYKKEFNQESVLKTQHKIKINF